MSEILGQVSKIKPGGSRTLYVSRVYEVDKSSGGSVTGTKTYYLAAGAMRVNGTLYYVLADHLGSASTVLDASGALVGKQRYYPFGETRYVTGSMQTDKLYTGQREMAGLGIYHYNARFYSPSINHFLSADTIVPGMSNPQNLNRFSYVLNNPLRYTDPTGHRACGDEEAVSCETGLLNNPSNHTNKGCGGPGQQSCLGKSKKDKDESKDDDILDRNENDWERAFLAVTNGLGGPADLAGGLLLAGFGVYGLVGALSVGPVGILAAPGFMAVIAVGVLWAGVGAQEIYQMSHPKYEIDPLLPVHYFFPDALRR